MTNSVEDGLMILQRENILIFTGITGQGKTWHCLEILSRMSNNLVVQIDSLNLDLREWDRLIGTEENIIIWIDDLRAALLGSQKAFFERLHMQLYKCKGNMKVVLSISSSELHQIHDDKPHVLCDRYTIDLNAELKDVNKRQEMLTEYLKRGKSKKSNEYRFLSISIIPNSYTERFQRKPYRITKNTIRKISKLSPCLGFPECCRRFCTEHESFSMGISYFKKPTQSTIDLLSALSKSSDEDQRISFIVLCLLCLNPPHIDLNNIHAMFEKSLQEIVNVKITSNTIFDGNILKHIKPQFVEIINESNIYFEKEAMECAVAIVLCGLNKLSQEYFIGRCPISLILAVCRPEMMAQRIPEPLLCKRFIDEIMFKPFRHSVKRIFRCLHRLNIWKVFDQKLNIQDNLLKKAIRLEIARNIASPDYNDCESRKIMKPLYMQGFRDNNERYDNLAKILNLIMDSLHFSFLSMLNEDDGSANNLRESVIIFINVLRLPYFLLFCSRMLSLSSEKDERMSFSREYDMIGVLKYVFHCPIDFLKKMRKLVSIHWKDLDLYNTFRLRQLIFDCGNMYGSSDEFTKFIQSSLEDDEFELLDILSILSRAKDCQENAILQKCIQLAIEDKNVGLCMHLRSYIMSESSFRGKLLDATSMHTEQSYSFKYVYSIRHQNEDYLAAAMVFRCNDLQLCSIVNPSVEYYKSLLFRLLDEFSVFYICSPLGMLKLYECQKCFVRHFNDSGSSEILHERFNNSIDTCLFVSQKRNEYLGSSVYTLCNLHLYDFIFLNEYAKDSVNLKSAIERIELERMKIFNQILNKFSQNQGINVDIFTEACIKDYYLMVRLILREEYETEEDVMCNGFLQACTNGSTLVVDTFLSWKQGIIPEEILVEGLRKATDRLHAQTCACIIMSCPILNYFRRDSIDKNDELLKCVCKAIHVCGRKYKKCIEELYHIKGLYEIINHILLPR